MRGLRPLGCAALCLLLGLNAPAAAFQPASPVAKNATATGTQVEVVFTPGQDAAGLIIDTITKARRQILVQAFSFTHDGIARALIDAHKRGVEVRVIADREQTQKMRREQISVMAAAGVPVWLDGEHLGAHNKVMIIDTAAAHPIVITGSYNFTKAAQYRNAENVLLLRGNRALAQTYHDNWQRHLLHARPFNAARKNNR
jgi:phosphatidylserine/phosphatidylglycerophosphate/cardiolipin synthase-like enzyme